MRPESIKKYEAVRKDIEGGATLEKALKDHKMASATYYEAKKLSGKPKKKYSRKQEYIDIAMAAPQEDTGLVSVVFCRPDQLERVLRGSK